MSSILDALNKSDAERRRGQIPTLGSHLPPHRRPPPRRRRPWLLPLIAVVALAGAWFGGLFDRDGSTPAPEPLAETSESAPAPSDPAVSDPESAGTTSQEEAQQLPQTEQLASSDPDSSAPTQPTGRLGFGPFPPQHPPTGHPEPGESGTAPTTPPPVPTAAAAPEAVAPTTDTETTSAPPTSIAAAQTPDVEPSPTAPVAELSATPPSSVPQFHELPFAVRRTLPEISVTMHMYNTDPERRFALINGTRVRDGQPIEGGLDVIAIRSDGIVLRYEGTEFVHPIR